MKTKKYPFKCCQCGMCCVLMTCQIGQFILGIAKDEPCHVLVFEGDKAICKLAPYVVPVGDGCCIKARAFRDGVEYDFASLPDELKRHAVVQVRQGGSLLTLAEGGN